MKKKPTSKQGSAGPFTVQDLAKIMAMVESRVIDELLETSKKDNSRMDRIYKSLFNLEAAQNNQNSKIRALESQLSCGEKTGHHFTVQYARVQDTDFRCIKCGFEYTKYNPNLSRKEKKLLKIVLKGRK